ncbi:putative repeat protein (TIGR01451 family) [Novosphingobium sp. PhB165]|uniref:hypothetical protein n=1 Tax=Novosphingobium sp. PhB165 TaxID=2485105 RepID=UPI0010EE8FA9|nr:hypothetical protein [Novosphingobium sp. PhB165]TCM21713.1 putative repeat protein (TIGR01451 family) [Novosphingobium sp. PhB165]
MNRNIPARLISSAAAVALGIAFAGAASAAEPVSLKGDVQVEKVVTENGAAKTVLAPPTTVVPGDRLLFTTRYSNDGDKPVDNFVVTNPLPAPVRLAADEGGYEVSVDGGKTFGKLAALTVADAAGTRRAAQLEDVTHIRWTLAHLAPRAAGALEYHAVVR